MENKQTQKPDLLLDAADPDVVEAVYANVRPARNEALWDKIKGGLIVAILLAVLKAVQFASADSGPATPPPPTPPPLHTHKTNYPSLSLHKKETVLCLHHL